MFCFRKDLKQKLEFTHRHLSTELPAAEFSVYSLTRCLLLDLQLRITTPCTQEHLLLSNTSLPSAWLFNQVPSKHAPGLFPQPCSHTSSPEPPDPQSRSSDLDRRHDSSQHSYSLEQLRHFYRWHWHLNTSKEPSVSKFRALNSSQYTNRKVCKDWGQRPWKLSPATNTIHTGIKPAL